MTAREQWAIVFGVVLLLAIALGTSTYYLADELFPIAVGSVAPPITAVTLDSTARARTLADYKGKVIVLNVWATWCEPCRVEMPSLEKLYEQFGQKGLAIVAVSVDDAGTAPLIRAFVKEYHLTFEVLHDPTQRTKSTYQITGFPETFVIGREGIIRKKVIGAADWSSEANRALIRELLGTTIASR